MSLEVRAPLAPMEALSVEEIPEGGEWQYEPKWDGFRCVAFREGKNVELQSKAEQPLARYFPELVEALLALDARQFVLDGEIAVPEGRCFSFDSLLQRIHPAASRIAKLSEQTPAIFIVFDLLAGADGKSLLQVPLQDRRGKLEEFAKEFLRDQRILRLSPATPKLDIARKWLAKAGSTLDGIIAKRRDLGYCSGERSGMVKVKNYRSADCVIGGFRYATGKKVIGSLLLGLYDDSGLLNHVGFTSAFSAAERASLVSKLKPHIGPPGFTGQAPGGPSRWNRGKSNEWVPLKPELVAEVCYDHVTGARFRHGTRILRWRPDKASEQCTMDQLQQEGAYLLDLIK